MASQVHTDVETDHRALLHLHDTSAKQLRETRHSCPARIGTLPVREGSGAEAGRAGAPQVKPPEMGTAQLFQERIKGDTKTPGEQ